MPYIEGDQVRTGEGFAPITGADRSLRVELQAPKPITVSGNAPTTVDFAALVPTGEYRNGAHVSVEHDDFVVRGVYDGSVWGEASRVSRIVVQAKAAAPDSTHAPLVAGNLLELFVDSGDLSVTDSPSTQTFTESSIVFTVVRVTVSNPITSNQRVRVHRNGRYPVHVAANVTGQDAGVGGVVIGANKAYVDLYSNGSAWTLRPEAVAVDAGESLSLSFNSTATLSHTITTTDGQPYRATYPNGSVVRIGSGVAHTQTFTATAGSVSIDLEPSSKIKRIEGLSAVFNFDIAALSRMSGIEYLAINNTAIGGDLYALSNLVYLKTLYVNHTSIYGDLSALSNLVNLTTLHLHVTSIKGDINALRDLTKIVMMRIDNASISGDPSALSALTALTTLYATYGKVKGDFTSLSSLSSLTTLLYSAALTSTQVNTMISQLVASGLTGVTANIGYGNAARTSASDADATTLSGRGWTLTTTA